MKLITYQSKIKPKLTASGGLFDLDKMEADLAEYEADMVQPGFWDDSEKAQSVIDVNNALKKVYDEFNNLADEYEELTLLNEMVKE